MSKKRNAEEELFRTEGIKYFAFDENNEGDANEVQMEVDEAGCSSWVPKNDEDKVDSTESKTEVLFDTVDPIYQSAMELHLARVKYGVPYVKEEPWELQVQAYNQKTNMKVECEHVSDNDVAYNPDLKASDSDDSVFETNKN